MPALFSGINRKKTPYIVLIAALAGAWTVFGPYGFLKYYRVARELKQIEIKNEELRQANNELQHEINRLKKDPAYLEEVARQQYGFIRKNEVIYDFPEKKKKHE